MTKPSTASSAAQSAAASIGLGDAYAVDGPDANRKLYAAWADTYESEFMTENEYLYHQQVAAVFGAGWSDAGVIDGAVLDVGCGTGVVGAELARLGVQAIDGIDISPEMLARAAEKTHQGLPLYRHLLEADLTQPIELPNNAYDGVVSAGAFTHGHLGPEPISELVRLARPGARCALGINAAHFEELRFDDWLSQRETHGQICELGFEVRPIYGDADPDDANRWTRIAVFSVV